MSTSTLTIGLILPDVLGTYGDDGNALVLRQRARMRGIPAEIHRVTLRDELPESCDLYTVGGGEDTAQVLAAEYLREHHGLTRAAEKGTPILAICAGLQVLGESFGANNTTIAGVGLLDATTTPLAKRAIGELVTRPAGTDTDGSWAAHGQLTDDLQGFENHMGATVLGPDAQPLGAVTYGIGNGAAAASSELTAPEGAVQGSILATYMHGCALARNPQLADLLLARALGVRLEELAPIELPEIERMRSQRTTAAKKRHAALTAKD